MQKVLWKDSNQVICVVIGSAISAAISLGVTALFAHMVVTGKIGERTGGLLVTAFVVPAVFIGCEISVRAIKKKMAYIPVAASVVYLLVMLLAGMLLVEGKMIFSWGYTVAIGTGCAISCVKCLKKPARKHVKKRRSR